MIKFIELATDKAELLEAELPQQVRSGKLRAKKGQKEASIAADQHSEAEIMALRPARARKAGSPPPEIFNQIGQRLRNVYNEVLTQTVPDRFVDLLQALEAALPNEPPNTANAVDTPPREERRAATRKTPDQQ